MVPDKSRRQKKRLGVLGRILAIKNKRRGKTLGSVALSAEIDRKIFWRMHKVITDKDNTA